MPRFEKVENITSEYMHIVEDDLLQVVVVVRHCFMPGVNTAATKRECLSRVVEQVAENVNDSFHDFEHCLFKL